MQNGGTKCLNFSFPQRKRLENASHRLPALSLFLSQKVMPGTTRGSLHAAKSMTGGVVGNIQMIEEIFVHLHSVPGDVMEADRFG
jgi:hypothetical protein